MRNTLILTVFLGSLIGSGSAFAAIANKPHEQHQGVATIDRSESGMITAMDADNHTITLGNAGTFAVPDTVDFSSLTTGEQVSVDYTDYLEKNQIVVNSVRPF